MKKILLFTLAILSLTSLFAQVTISGTYLPVVNTQIKQVWNQNPNTNSIVLPAPAYSSDSNDAAQVWDYSNSFPLSANVDTFALRTYSPDSTSVIVNLAGDSISHYFPGATHVSFIESPFADADSLWSFYRVDTSGMYNLGHFILKSPNISGLVFDDTTLTFVNEELVVPFELNYGDHYSDTSIQEAYFMYEYNGNNYPAKYIKETHFDYNVNGHGTLKTPSGTFNDVLLATGFVEKRDSLLIEFTPGNYTHIPNSNVPGLNDYSAGKRHFFLANNTFATSILMQVNTHATTSNVHYGWYTLPSEVGTIQGTVYEDTLSNPGVIADAEVYLFREHGNFTRDDVLATTVTDNNGVYILEDIPYGMYRVAARMMNNHANYTPEHSYLTYFEDSTSNVDTINPALGVDWTQCDLITTTGPTTLGKDIYLRHDTLAASQDTAVSSLLSGTLTGVNFSKIGGNDPIPGIDIIIKKNPGSKPIISTQTDANGEFFFENLPNGDYKIWVDMPGVGMANTYTFEVFDGIFNRCEFDFSSDLNNIERTGQNATTCLTVTIDEMNKAFNQVSIYPNPYEFSSVITLELKEQSMVSVKVFDITGKLIQSIIDNKEIIGVHDFEIDPITDAGIYLVKVNIGEKVITKRLVKL
jgi:hypothetical protein